MEEDPSWYLVSGADQAIPTAAQKFMAKRAGSHTTEVKGGSHLALVSHAEAAADLITAADRATKLVSRSPAPGARVAAGLVHVAVGGLGEGRDVVLVEISDDLRRTLPPAARLPGTSCPGVTSAPAATSAPAPMWAPFIRIAPMPTRAPVST